MAKSPQLNYHTNLLKSLNKKYGFIDTSKRVERLSSGLLSVDYVLGGGYSAGMTTVVGLEGSGKSTLCTHALGASIKKNLPLNTYFDAEGTIHETYAGAIFRGINVPNINTAFTDGRVNLISDNGLERFFNFHATLMKKIPDKVWNDILGGWTYREERRSGLLDAIGLKIDKKLSTEKHNYAPTDYAGPEGVTIVDSLASLITEETEEDGPNNRMGGPNAPAFSKHMPRVVPGLTRKGLILVATNQLRLKPGVLYGSPEYAPGGEAPKHYASVRCKMDKRATPQDAARDKESGMGVEESVAGGGTDLYQYIHMTNEKNKFGRPRLKSMMRIWVSDKFGKARGVDIVFDTLNYLKLTGQCTGSAKSNIKFTLKDSVNEKVRAKLNGKKLTWLEFKAMILAEGNYKPALEIANKRWKNGVPQLRAALFVQLKRDDTIYETKDLKAEASEDLEA